MQAPGMAGPGMQAPGMGPGMGGPRPVYQQPPLNPGYRQPPPQMGQPPQQFNPQRPPMPVHDDGPPPLQNIDSIDPAIKKKSLIDNIQKKCKEYKKNKINWILF